MKFKILRLEDKDRELNGDSRQTKSLGLTPNSALKHLAKYELAGQWKEMAFAGDHYCLAFGAADTWSQKYNLVWDRILGLNIFAEDIARTELDYYKTVMGEYGLPLDNRSGTSTTQRRSACL